MMMLAHDTRLITYFTGEEVEVLRNLIQERIEFLETTGMDQDDQRALSEIITRFP